MTVPESYRFCRKVARNRAKNFYYAFRLLPAAKQDAICAVYAFMRHCDDLSDEAGASRAALGAWRAELDRALAGQAGGDPIWPGFLDAVHRFSIPHHIFFDMIDGVESDLDPRPVHTFDDLYRYCYRVASVVGLSVIHIFGYRDAGAPLLAEKCGVAFQLTNIIRDVREDAAMGRIYLPVEDRQRFGVATMEDSPAMRELLRFEGGRARDLYREAAPLPGMIDPDSRPALIAMIDIYRELFDRIESSGYSVFESRIAVPRWRKVWLMARAFVRR